MINWIMLPPIDLHPHQATDCDFLNLSVNPVCLVDIHTHQMLEDNEDRGNTHRPLISVLLMVKLNEVQ